MSAPQRSLLNNRIRKRRSDEPGEEVINQVVTTEISEDEMERVADLLRGFSQHNLDGDLFSIIVLRGTASGGVTREQITLSVQALSQRANPHHCYGRVPLYKTANDGDLISTSVWCQRSDYQGIARGKQAARMGHVSFQQPASFDYEEKACVKRFNRRTANQIIAFSHTGMSATGNCYKL